MLGEGAGWRGGCVLREGWRSQAEARKGTAAGRDERRPPAEMLGEECGQDRRQRHAEVAEHAVDADGAPGPAPAASTSMAVPMGGRSR